MTVQVPTRALHAAVSTTVCVEVAGSSVSTLAGTASGGQSVASRSFAAPQAEVEIGWFWSLAKRIMTVDWGYHG